MMNSGSLEIESGRPVMVFYSFRHDKDRIKAFLKSGVRELNGPEDIKDWNDGKIPVLLAHPGRSFVGIEQASEYVEIANRRILEAGKR